MMMQKLLFLTGIFVCCQSAKISREQFGGGSSVVFSGSLTHDDTWSQVTLLKAANVLDETSNDVIRIVLNSIQQRVTVHLHSEHGIKESRHFPLTIYSDDGSYSVTIVIHDVDGLFARIRVYINCILVGTEYVAVDIQELLSDTKITTIHHGFALYDDTIDEVLENADCERMQRQQPSTHQDTMLREMATTLQEIQRMLHSQTREMSMFRRTLETCEMCKMKPSDPCNPSPCYDGVQCYARGDEAQCGRCPSGYAGDGRKCTRTVTCSEQPCFDGQSGTIR